MSDATMSSGAEASAVPSRRIISALHAAVVLTLLCGVCLAPWQFDEGWTDLTIRAARHTGFYGYVIDNAGVEYTFMKPWFWFLNHLCFPALGPGHVFLMRLPAFFLAVAGWGAVVYVLRRLDLKSPVALAGAAAFWTVTGVAFLITLRGEALYVPLLAAALAASVKLAEMPSRSTLLFGLALIPLAVSCHPTGLCVPIVLAVALPFCRGSVGWRSRKTWSWLAPALLICAAAAALLTLWDLSPAGFLERLRFVSTVDDGHSHAWWQEYARFVSLLFNWPPAFFAYAAATAAFLRFCAKGRNSPRIRSMLFVQVTAIELFLIANPAKWVWYMAAFAPWGCVGAAWGMSALCRRASLVGRLLAIGFLVWLVELVVMPRYEPAVVGPSLFHMSVLEPAFGLSDTPDEKTLRSIPALIGDRSVVASAFLFPALDGTHLGSYHQMTPPEVVIGEPDPDGLPYEAIRWGDARYQPVLRFKYEGRSVVLAELKPAVRSPAVQVQRP